MRTQTKQHAPGFTEAHAYGLRCSSRARVTLALLLIGILLASISMTHPPAMMAEGLRNNRNNSPSNVPAKKWTVTGTPTAIPAIDQAVQNIMTANGIRGGSLAVIQGTRLVYARGYTLAEPDYTVIQPTTYFRQASVSKFFTALAVYQLLEQNQRVYNSPFTLNTPIQDILKLPVIQLTFDGKESDKNPRKEFYQITLRHLLEMDSGIDPGAVLWGDVPATKMFYGSLPATPMQMVRYAATLPLVNTPGDTTQTRYNNTGYMILGQVVAKMRGTDSFIDAITPTLLAPLSIKRVRASHSLVEDQLPNEAQYDWTGTPLTAPSVMSPAQPNVSQAYGRFNLENTGGSGGLSAAATDVARLLAALNVRPNPPMLSLTTLNNLLANAAQATATHTGPDNHGWYGLDGTTVLNADQKQYSASKGGWLNGSQNSFIFNTGGTSYVFCLNGNVTDNTYNLGVSDEIMKHDWSKDPDQFHVYGMLSFNSREPLLNPSLDLILKSRQRQTDLQRDPLLFRLPPAIRSVPTPR